jgi:hypothetical protein
MVDIVDAPAAVDVYAVKVTVEDGELREQSDWLATVRSPTIAAVLMGALEMVEGVPPEVHFEIREP